jgi:hypothetical protein
VQSQPERDLVHLYAAADRYLLAQSAPEICPPDNLVRLSMNALQKKLKQKKKQQKKVMMKNKTKEKESLWLECSPHGV